MPAHHTDRSKMDGSGPQAVRLLESITGPCAPRTASNAIAESVMPSRLSISSATRSFDRSQPSPTSPQLHRHRQADGAAVGALQIVPLAIAETCPLPTWQVRAQLNLRFMNRRLDPPAQGWRKRCVRRRQHPRNTELPPANSRQTRDQASCDDNPSCSKAGCSSVASALGRLQRVERLTFRSCPARDNIPPTVRLQGRVELVQVHRPLRVTSMVTTFALALPGSGG